MIKIAVRAKVKETDEFIEHHINMDNKIYNLYNDRLYDFISDFLTKIHGDIFKWFRFWTVY